MSGILAVSPTDCKTARRHLRGGDARTARRANVLLLLAASWSVRDIRQALFCSSDLVADVRRGYRNGGLSGALGRAGRVREWPWWYECVLRWVLEFSPPELGYPRSRWTCRLLAASLDDRFALRVGRETVRRALGRMEVVWRRPRPVVGPSDPAHDAKMQALRDRLGAVPASEVVVFQDEVQIDLNPKVGGQWMLTGAQAAVVTPGDNDRRHLAVSQVGATGTLLVSAPTRRRNSDQFIAHLSDLCHRLRRWRVIHVVCDNAAFHTSKRVRDWVAKKAGRVVLHFLPTRAPEENPVERVFWRLHEAVTRNHRHRTMDELMDAVWDWLHADGRARPYDLKAKP